MEDELTQAEALVADAEDQTLVDTNSHSDNANDEKPDDESSKDESKDEIDPTEKIKKLNSENKNLRSRLRTAEASLTEKQTDLQSELDRISSERNTLKSQYDSLIQSLRFERLTTSITEASRKAGAIEPTAVLALANSTSVEYDENHQPKNIEVVIESLKSQFPKLFGGSAINGNAGARSERNGNLEALTPKERMSKAFADKT